MPVCALIRLITGASCIINQENSELEETKAHGMLTSRFPIPDIPMFKRFLMQYRLPQH